MTATTKEAANSLAKTFAALEAFETYREQVFYAREDHEHFPDIEFFRKLADVCVAAAGEMEEAPVESWPAASHLVELARFLEKLWAVDPDDPEGRKKAVFYMPDEGLYGPFEAAARFLRASTRHRKMETVTELLEERPGDTPISLRQVAAMTGYSLAIIDAEKRNPGSQLAPKGPIAADSSDYPIFELERSEALANAGDFSGSALQLRIVAKQLKARGIAH